MMRFVLAYLMISSIAVPPRQATADPLRRASCLDTRRTLPRPSLRPLLKGFESSRPLHPFLRSAIAAIERLDFNAALRYFEMATNIGLCLPGSRCYWHYLMARVVDSVWRGPRTTVRSWKEAETVATALANSALAIRVDRGRVDSRLECTAWRYYQLAHLANRGSPSPLVGLAALRAEQGRRSEALALLARVLKKRIRKGLDWYNVGYVYAALRIREKALFYLKRSLESGCSNCREWATISDDYRHYKNDPEFRRILSPFH